MTPPPPPNTLMCAGIPLFEQIDNIFEVFDVSALVAGNRYPLGVFFYGGIDDFLYRAIVSEMNDFNPGILQDPAHDIDRSVMAVKE